MYNPSRDKSEGFSENHRKLSRVLGIGCQMNGLAADYQLGLCIAKLGVVE